MCFLSRGAEVSCVVLSLHLPLSSWECKGPIKQTIHKTSLRKSGYFIHPTQQRRLQSFLTFNKSFFFLEKIINVWKKSDKCRLSWFKEFRSLANSFAKSGQIGHETSLQFNARQAICNCFEANLLIGYLHSEKYVLTHCNLIHYLEA